MGQPGANASASVSILAVLLVVGCAPISPSPETEEKDRDHSGESTARDEPAEEPSESAEPSGEESDADSQAVRSEHGWNGGAIETTTESGVTFAVPADWERFAASEGASGDEAVYFWEDDDGIYRHGESAVFNTGGPGDPQLAVSAYIDVVAGMGDNPDGGDRSEPEDLDIPGVDDAVRVDYALPQPGFPDVAEGSVIGFTVTTGEVVLFTVTADGDTATSELTEEIISTVVVGAPPGGGV